MTKTNSKTKKTAAIEAMKKSITPAAPELGAKVDLKALKNKYKQPAAPVTPAPVATPKKSATKKPAAPKLKIEIPIRGIDNDTINFSPKDVKQTLSVVAKDVKWGKGEQRHDGCFAKIIESGAMLDFGDKGDGYTVYAAHLHCIVKEMEAAKNLVCQMEVTAEGLTLYWKQDGVKGKSTLVWRPAEDNKVYEALLSYEDFDKEIAGKTMNEEDADWLNDGTW